jgi:hypothetical protein
VGIKGLYRISRLPFTGRPPDDWRYQLPPVGDRFFETVIPVRRQNAYNDVAIRSSRFPTPGGLWKTFANKWLERIAD